MGKTSYLSLLTIAAVASLASCSGDDLENPASEGNTTFVLQLADAPQSRDLGDGTKAVDLYYAVYQHGETTPLITSRAENHFAGGTVNVSIPLVVGMNYDIIWWAQSPDATCYTLDFDKRNLTVSYDGAVSNAEDRDAFYQMTTTGTITSGGGNKPVSLYRPFAQLNFGTDDMTAKAVISSFGVTTDASGAITSSTVRTSVSTTAYTAMNLMDGTVSNPQAVTFAAAPMNYGETFPAGSGYAYLNMDYLLMPAQQELNNVTLTVTKDGSATAMNTVSVPNVPMQRNYRTNIYGSLITSTTNFAVSIEPGFNTPSLTVAQWDGKTVTYPAVDEATKSVAVQAPSDLVGLAHMVSGTNGQTANDFSGYTVKLNGDFDFRGFEFPMIAAGSTRSGGEGTGAAFSGVFDGQGHTIKNITISQPSAAENAAVGFIANLKGPNATLKNLNVESLNINTSAQQAGLVGLVTGGATVSGVNVKSGSVNGAEAAGAIAGRVMIDGSISNCTNGANVTSKSSNAGGIVGSSYRTAAGKQTVISGCSNSGTIYAANVGAGGISGLNTGLVENCTNTGKVSAVTNSAGGIVGVQQSAGYIRGCNNSGDVTCNGTLGVGGIVGWVKYLNDAGGYPVQNIIEVTGNTNSGTVTGKGTDTYGVSGIVGLWYQAGVCDNNINLAPAVNATGMCAGITVSQTNGDNPNKVDPYVLMLYVRNNVSTTPESKLTGSLKGQYVYINDAKAVSMSGNKDTQN